MKMKEIGCVPREPPPPLSDQPMHREMMDRDKGNSENINFDSNGLSILYLWKYVSPTTSVGVLTV